MIGSAINNALQGLRAASRRTEVASRNIAGATQDGYVRKEVVIDSGPLGLTLRGYIRSEDLQLFRQATGERALLSGMQAEMTARTALADTLGEPRLGNDLGSLLGEMEQEMLRLSAQPDSTTVQVDLVDKADAVARKLGALSDSVQQERLAADGRIASVVGEVNDAIAEISDLNQQIAAVPDYSDSTELQDQRDRALTRLSEHLPVRTFETGNGAITVLTREGLTLVDTEPHLLEFSQTQAMAPELSYDSGFGALSGLTLEGVDITPGTAASQQPREGTLAGLFKVRDVAMPEAQAQLDELASALIDAFQSADASITDPATQAGILTDAGQPHDRGDAASKVGLASRIAINAAVDPDQGGNAWRMRTGVHAASAGDPGEGAQARAFAAAFDESRSFDSARGLSTQAKLTEWANQLTTFQNGRRTSVESRAEYQSALVSALDARLSEKQGVDLDKELQDVLLFERSYSASASVLQTAQRMLDELLDAV